MTCRAQASPRSSLTDYEARAESLLMNATRVFLASGSGFADGLPNARVTLWPEFKRDVGDFAIGRVYNELAERFETITDTVRVEALPVQISTAEYVLSWLAHYVDDLERRRLLSVLLRHRSYRSNGAMRRTMEELKIKEHRSTVWRQYRAALADIVAGIVIDRVDVDLLEKNLLT